MLTRRLAAAGFGVHGTRWRDRDELILLNVTAARSCLTVADGGCARWHCEPASGPAIDPATLTAIIAHILGAPHTADSTPGPAAYRAFPLKRRRRAMPARPGPDRGRADLRGPRIVRGHQRNRDH